MSRYDELKYLVPPRIQSILATARREPASAALSNFKYWIRRHKREVNELRERVQNRIVRRTDEYRRLGLSIDRPEFITPAMRDEMELVYQLDHGISVATEEYNAIKAEVEARGN
jgi:hypothetical protein